MSTLEEIKARVEKSTKGPWFRDSTTEASETTENVVARSWDVARCCGADTHPDSGRAEQAKADADFIAHSRTDVPNLISALEAVEQRLQWLDAIQDTSGHIRYNLNAGGTASIIRQTITEALR